jgi:lipoprotein-releasing system permease protein
LKFEFFIARKLLKNEVEGKKVSQPIVRISIISIALAMIVNIITLAVVKGFQQEVRDKVIGFGAHAVISKAGENTIYESEPISIHQSFYPSLIQTKKIKHIQPVAYKPALLQSNISEKNPEIQQEIEGVLVKGVDKSYDWSFFAANLIKGRLPIYNNTTTSDEILISAKIANDLNYKLGDEVRTFFVKNKPIKKMFKIVGIYETGYEELDKQMIIVDLRHIQQLNDWGMQVSVTVSDTLHNGNLVIQANPIGGNGNYRLDWGYGYDNIGAYGFYPTKDTIIRVIASDYWMFMDGKDGETSIPDTAYLKVKIHHNSSNYQAIKTNVDGLVEKKYLDQSGYHFSITAGDRTIEFTQIDGKGSYHNYVGAFECAVNNWNSLEEDVRVIKNQVLLGGPKNHLLKVTSIVDSQSDIFVWLSFLDINVWIILSLMIIIGVINMGSALLVMILVKTNFIGMMKALGASNWTIRKVFLHQAGFLILRGMAWGNVIGIGFCVLQKYFKIIPLNSEVYYLNAVPIQLNIGILIVLNSATLIVCLVALIIPSYIVTRISPSKSIKFN